MNKQISGIIKHLINMNTEDRTDSKHLNIEIIENNEFNGCNVKIEATGTWMKYFCIRTFQADAWRNVNKKLFVHVGNRVSQTYEKYVIDDGIILGLELKPYVDDCDYYVSLVFDIPKRTLRNKFPVIQKYIKTIADEHTDIKIKLIGSDNFWKEDEKVNKCIKLIGECITTIMIYDSTNNCRDNFVQKYLGVSTKDAAMEKCEKILSQQILQYNKDEFKLN